MGDYFQFRGKFAQMNFALRRKSRWENEEVVRYNLVFEKADDLATLLSMGADETVVLDNESIPFSQFKESYISKANRIYVDHEVEFMDRVSQADIPSVIQKLIEKGHL